MELVVGKDRSVHGVKLIVSSADGVNQMCHRPLQRIVPFEVNNDETNEQDTNTVDDVNSSRGKPTRNAAREEQLMRRLKEKYNG